MRLAFAFAIGTIVLSLAAGARAQRAPLTPEARKEAAERFDRGLRLFNQGENAGALVEFKRTYELTGDPSTLLNIGLVYAELKRPVDAVDALDTLLKSNAKLGPEQRQKAERVRAEQMTFVSFLQIEANVPSMIEVDGVEAGHTPLEGTLRVAAGHHIVGAVAAGYPPSRKTIDIAGGETQKLSFLLVPGEAALGHVALHCALPAADVWVDGNQSGHTPLTQTLALNPGLHHVEVRRDGYRTAAADIKLDLGAVADVTLEPEVDAAALAQSGGSLAITPSETGAEVSIDGRPAGAAGRRRSACPWDRTTSSSPAPGSSLPRWTSPSRAARPSTPPSPCSPTPRPATPTWRGSTPGASGAGRSAGSASPRSSREQCSTPSDTATSTAPTPTTTPSTTT